LHLLLKLVAGNIDMSHGIVDPDAKYQF